MNVKNILISLFVLLPFSLQAFNMPSIFSKPWNTFAPLFWNKSNITINPFHSTLDAEINAEINHYEQTQQHLAHARKQSLSWRPTEEKAFCDYKDAKTTEAFVSTLITTTLELQNHYKYQNNPKKLIKKAKEIAGKEHYITQISLDTIWQSLQKTPVQKPDDIIDLTDEQYNTTVKMTAVSLLFNQMQTSNKQMLSEKLQEAQVKVVGQINKKNSYIHYPATCIVNLEKELPPFTYFPNQKFKDRQKIAFDESHPQFITTQNTKNPIHKSSIDRSHHKTHLPFQISLYPNTSYFNAGYYMVPNQKSKDKKVNSQPFTGKANILGGGIFKYDGNGNDIGKYGYRDKNGNMKEID